MPPPPPAPPEVWHVADRPTSLAATKSALPGSAKFGLLFETAAGQGRS